MSFYRLLIIILLFNFTTYGKYVIYILLWNGSGSAPSEAWIGIPLRIGPRGWESSNSSFTQRWGFECTFEAKLNGSLINCSATDDWLAKEWPRNGFWVAFRVQEFCSAVVNVKSSCLYVARCSPYFPCYTVRQHGPPCPRSPNAGNYYLLYYYYYCY